MKEVTYGWYPSANDIYRSKGRPSTSHLECLYNHHESMYYQGKMGAPPPELMIMGVTAGSVSTPQDQKRLRSKTVSVPKFKPVPKLHIPTPTECWNKSTQKGVSETSWGIVGESSTIPIHNEVNWPLPLKKQQQHLQQQQQQQIWKQQFTPQQQQQLLKEHIKNHQFRSLTERQASPQYAWGLRKPQTPQTSRPLSPSSADIKWPLAKNVSSTRPQTSSSSQIGPSSSRSQKPRPASSPVQSAKQKQESLKQYTPAPPNEKNVSDSKRPSRIQSATVHRDKTPLPARPQTASPRKQNSSPRHPMSSKREKSARCVTRPEAPVPFVYDVNYENVCEAGDDEEGIIHRDDSIDEDEYEENLKKYGWRAQVHGDPYKLKRPLPRMSYAVTCHEPDVPPEPPGIHMESNEPFFYNTIPNKPMAVDVDKEWISEVIMAKRLELQKREGGIKYSYKNFSFVY